MSDHSTSANTIASTMLVDNNAHRDRLDANQGRLRVRFAPSPTGVLHVGGVRTALVNRFFSEYQGGEYLVRIEDTDQKRSTQEAIDAILSGLDDLELSSDGDVVFQSHNIAEHRRVAQELLERGHAYKCYCTPQELEEMRESMRRGNMPRAYNDCWRDKQPDEEQAKHPFTVRLKVNRDEPSTTIEDLVQGTVSIPTAQVDDYILLRADGTPTYMCSVVVDDIMMGITHVIRGVDHINNTARQFHLFKAIGTFLPTFAHLPLIHDDDGRKLSKRTGASSVQEFLAQGILPDVLREHLLGLGYSGDPADVIAHRESFDIKRIQKSSSRFDRPKLLHRNEQRIMKTPSHQLMKDVTPFLTQSQRSNTSGLQRFEAGLSFVSHRANTLVALALEGSFLISRPSSAEVPDSLVPLLSHPIINEIYRSWCAIPVAHWDDEAMVSLKGLLKEHNVKMGGAGPPLRWLLTGSSQSAGSIGEIIGALGKEETCIRIKTHHKTLDD